MRTRTNLLIDSSALSAYLLAADPAITGIAVHEYASLGFTLAALVHLVLHRTGAVRTMRRFAGRLACFSFAGSGTAASAAPAAGSSSASSTGTLTCLRTGCTAAPCHATAGSGTGSGAFGGRC